MLAASVGLPNAETYRAWLSDSTTAAAARLHHSHGRYTLVNGLAVAADWDALVSGELLATIILTESGQEDNGKAAWTGTLPDGNRVLTSSHCGDWESGDPDDQGPVGAPYEVDSTWTLWQDSPCDYQWGIYCFEN